MVKHDIKEISTYTLICSSRYGSGEDAAYQPQYFKFNAANPLSGTEQPSGFRFDASAGVSCGRSNCFPAFAKGFAPAGCKQLSSKLLLCQAGSHCDQVVHQALLT